MTTSSACQRLRWILAGSLLASIALAREPGIPPSLPPGLTLGLPIAVAQPDDLYLLNRASDAAYTLRDGNGAYQGQEAHIAVDALQLTWVPGASVFGGSYKAFVMLPFVETELTRTTPATGKPGNWSASGLANPKLQPLDLSWSLGSNWWVSSGVGFYPPLGRYERGAPIELAGNFWTVEPAIGLTRLKEGWNFSTQLAYNSNTTNPDNHYRSGDQLFLNMTLAAPVAGWNVGPVAYHAEQVTEDSNAGGRATYGGRIFAGSRQTGAGLLLASEWQRVHFYVMATRDFDVRNTLAGDKLWFNVSLPLQ